MLKSFFQCFLTKVCLYPVNELIEMRNVHPPLFFLTCSTFQKVCKKIVQKITVQEITPL